MTTSCLLAQASLAACARAILSWISEHPEFAFPVAPHSVPSATARTFLPTPPPQSPHPLLANYMPGCKEALPPTPTSPDEGGEQWRWR